MTSILSETLAPPRIATNGRSGRFERVAEVLQLLLHQQAGRRLRQVVRDAFDRRVRAMRRAERIVRRRRPRATRAPRELRIVLFLFRVEAEVLEQHDAAARRCASSTACCAGVADAVVGEHDRPAEQLGEAIATGRRLNSGVGLPFGRPRWLARMTVAPCSSAYWIVGSDDWIARVVADDAVLERDVEVDADEDPLALEIEVADGELHESRQV